jgi:hypothetical protein
MNEELEQAASIVVSQAAYMQGGVAIEFAACNAEKLPFIAIGCGCRVTPDGRRISLFTHREHAAGLLDAVAETGYLAVIFGQPSTHRSLQVKGRDVSIDPFVPGDFSLVMQYRDAFAADMHQIGLSRALVLAYLAIDPEALVVLSFTPYAVYEQTPGPGAGERIGTPA